MKLRRLLKYGWFIYTENNGFVFSVCQYGIEGALQIVNYRILFNGFIRRPKINIKWQP